VEEDPTSVEVKLMFDQDGQYIGFKVIVRGQAFDVTGAASRYVPVDMLDAADRARLQGLLNQSSDTDAPGESGNFDGGFVSSANQAARYARQRNRDGY
jgi:hypothetical protein